MELGRRCDEIVRLIDAVLNPDTTDDEPQPSALALIPVRTDSRRPRPGRGLR